MSFSSVGNRFHTRGCSDRERAVSESQIPPWKEDVAVAGGAQRRACWYVGGALQMQLLLLLLLTAGFPPQIDLPLTLMED